MRNRWCFGVLACLSGCMHRLAPVAPVQPPKFTVGDAYQALGEWRYPRIFNSYDVTGLGTVITDPPGPYTADDESYDPDALAAASPVLQLPAIVTITNLANGYSMDVRVNDRGPANPGRIIAVTPKVATLLAFPEGGVVEVEVALNAQKTAALDGALGQGPKLTAAPLAGISSQQLAAPGSLQAVGPSQNLDAGDDAGPAIASIPLSGQVTAYGASAGPLYVQVAGFGRERDAADTMNEALYGLPAEIVPVDGGDRVLYAVNIGPYNSVSDADAALQQVLGRGVADPEIIVR